MRVIAWLAFGVVLALQGCELPVDDCGGEPDCGKRPVDPGCAGEGAGYCAGDAVFECGADGSSYYDGDCADESTPRACVEGKLGIPFCAVSAEQDERCQGDPWPTLCDAGVLTICREGMVEEVRTCPGGACIVHDPMSFCALSTERDARCMVNGRPYLRELCDGGWVIRCIDGYAALMHQCGKAGCGDDSENAWCY
jgi:hypothetical protein